MRTKFDMARLVSLAIGQLAACSSPPGHRCARDIASQDWGAALASCEARLWAGFAPARALDAATAAYYAQRPRDVVRLAAFALGGPTEAEAHRLIGSAQLQLDDLGAAQAHLDAAVKLHAAGGNALAEARDHHQLSGVAARRGDLGRALSEISAASEAVRRAHDDRMAVFIDIAHADILRKIGDLAGAEAAIEHALAAARDPADRVFARLKRGVLHLDQGHPGLARDPLERALEEERAARLPRTSNLNALYLNLAFVERKAGAFTRALDYMEQAKRSGTDTMAYRLNRGLVFADMGRLAEASADLEAAEAERPEGDWAWRVPFRRAQVAAWLHDIPGAMVADRRAIAEVATLASKSGSFGPTVIANHREPHLHLVGLLAAERRWSDVLDVVATMDSQSLLGSREPASDVGPMPAESPRQPSVHLTPAPVAPPASRAVEDWKGRRLVIAVPGGARIWRLELHDGQVSGSDAGDAAVLAELARKLETEPGNVEAGRALGKAMLPELPPRTRVALLAVGPIARAPLAGLRTDDGPAIARYELVRALGLLPRARVPRGGFAPARAAVAIGDPGGDLPAAANEARRVARRLKGLALVGAAATRAAFASAAGAGVLHIAAHTTQRSDGATLDLADGPVAIADIARLVPAPRLVVLASCGASAGRDDAGNGSLTNAFLDAGAALVIGTRWSVGDADAARFIEAFYEAGGGRDPVRALGAVQRVSTLPATTWAAFEAFEARPVR